MGVYDDKEVSVVTPFNGSTVRYGWQTNIDEADKGVLGHQTLDAVSGPIVFGASKPKPARMTKERTTGNSTSFVDWQSYNSAKQAGWKKSKGVIYGPSPFNGPKSIRVVCEVAPGLSVAWNMRKTQYSRITGDLSALGIEVLTTTNGKQAVVGGNSFEGASIFGAKTRIADDQISVGYVAATKVDNLPDGWSAIAKNSGGDPTVAAP